MTEVQDTLGRRGAVARTMTLLCAAVIAVISASGGAHAQNQAFQDFFNDTCASGGVPGGSNLAARCADNGGDIAGASETSLNPSQVATNTEGSLARAEAMTDDAEDRLEKNREEEAGRYPTGLSAGEEMTFGNLSVFLNGRYETDDEDRDINEGERGYEAETFGVQLGADYRLSDRAIIGAIFGYDNTDSEFDPDPLINALGFGSNSGDTETDAYSITVYAGYNVTDNIYVDVTGGYGFADLDLTRNAVFVAGATTLQMLANAETDSQTWSFGGGIGYDYYQGAWSVGPYARFNYVDISVDGYTETDVLGTGLAQTVGDTDSESLTSVLGVSASYAISANFGVIVPQVRFEYEHEFENDATSTIVSLAENAAGTTFTAVGEDPDRNYFNLGASVLMILPNGLMSFVDYEALLGYEERSRHRITGGVRVEF